VDLRRTLIAKNLIYLISLKSQKKINFKLPLDAVRHKTVSDCGPAGVAMKRIADLLFEARMLKEIPRSGFQFLGVGRESVAEHVYSTAFIAYVMTQLHPEIDGLRLLSLCLVHDLPEARIGDLNSVHKAYVRADEPRAIAEMLQGLAFGSRIQQLFEEYRAGISPEARLARDADQLALILELKELDEIGYRPPQDWLPQVLSRLKTETGKKLAAGIMATRRHAWWWEAAASTR
jgi:putative hydrolase of HD superfamily